MSTNTASRRKFVKLGIAGASGLFFSGVSAKKLNAENSSQNRDKDFNIQNFGAKGDGKALNTKAIQKALDTCVKNGGGRVVVPKGTFLTGSIIIGNNTELNLEEGAEERSHLFKIITPFFAGNSAWLSIQF